MSRQNVVRFNDFRRGQSVRRGAADKVPASAKAPLEVDYPRCGAVLRLEAALLSEAPEIPCSGCDATIALRAEPLEIRR